MGKAETEAVGPLSTRQAAFTIKDRLDASKEVLSLLPDIGQFISHKNIDVFDLEDEEKSAAPLIENIRKNESSFSSAENISLQIFEQILCSVPARDVDLQTGIKFYLWANSDNEPVKDISKQKQWINRWTEEFNLEARVDKIYETVKASNLWPLEKISEYNDSTETRIKALKNSFSETSNIQYKSIFKDYLTAYEKIELYENTIFSALARSCAISLDEMEATRKAHADMNAVIFFEEVFFEEDNLEQIRNLRIVDEDPQELNKLQEKIERRLCKENQLINKIAVDKLNEFHQQQEVIEFMHSPEYIQARIECQLPISMNKHLYNEKLEIDKLFEI